MTTLFYIIASLVLGACGVEVGNPKQPDPQPKITQALDEDDLALVAGDNVNDLISAIATLNSSQSQTINLQLAQTDDVASCEQGIDQTLVSRSSKGDREFERGVGDNRRTIKSSTEVQSLMSYRSDEMPILCRDDHRVAVPWRQINKLTIEQNFSTVKSRTISKVSNQQLLASFKIVLQGSHEVSLSKEILEGGDIALTESHNFKIEKAISIQSKTSTKELSLVWENQKQDPYVIYKTRNGNGVSSLTIRSGVVAQTINDQETLTLNYKELSLDPATCSPLSGSIDITHQTKDKPEQSKSYTILVVDGELTFTSAEGLSIAVDREPCSLK